MKHGLLTVLKAAISVAIAIVLWHSVDGMTALSRLLEAKPFWLLASAAALTAQTVISAQRWRLTAAQLGLSIAPWAAIREYYLAQIVNQTLPGGVLGDAARAVRSRQEAGLKVAGQAVLFERIAGQIGLFVVLLPPLALSFVVPLGIDWPDWGPLIVIGGIVLACFIAIFAKRLPGAQAFGRAVLARPIRLRQIALSLSTALCNVAAFGAAAAAVSVTLSLSQAITLLPLILFAMVLPLSIGGWGFREGAAVLLLPLAGVSPEAALAASVAFGLVFLSATLPGLAITWLRPHSHLARYPPAI